MYVRHHRYTILVVFLRHEVGGGNVPRLLEFGRFLLGIR